MPTIIGPLPAQIAAGQPVSAAPVMTNFNWIVSQVNANVPPPFVPATLSRVMVSGIGLTSAVSGTPFILGKTTGGTACTKLLDTKSEFSTSTGLFTALADGDYQILASAMGIPNASTITQEPKINVRKNGTVFGQTLFFCEVGTAGFDTFVGHNFGVISLLAGETLSATATINFTGGGTGIQNLNVAIVGL